MTGSLISKIKNRSFFTRQKWGDKKLVISFCNLRRGQASGVVLYNLSSGTTQWIDLGANGPVNSCTGLWVDREFLYCLILREGQFYVSLIRKNGLKPIFCQPLPEVSDGHSICMFGEHLYVVSTGTDEVIRYEFAGDGFRKPEVFWKASNEKKDTHHLNSLLPINDELYVTGFGPREGELWRTATHGYIYNISIDSFVKKEIYHPHTLAQYKDRLYYCESSTQVFNSVGGDLKFSLDGYTRGICFLDEDTVVIGTSVGRKSSKSMGIVFNPADPGVVAGSCALTFCKLNAGPIKKVDLSEYASEIYDICLLS